MKAKCIKCAVAAAIAAVTIGVGAQGAGATKISTVSNMAGMIADDMQDMSDSAGDMDVDGLGAACSSMGLHVSIAQSHTKPKSYPKSAWRHYMTGLDYMEQAAEYCIEGAENYDPDLIEQSTTLLTQANEEVTLATEYLS